MRWRCERGWSLTEVVVVAGIIGIIASMAVPSLARAVAYYKLSQAATLLSGAIREAQIQSLREGRPWRVLIRPDGSGYLLQFAVDAATASTDCTDAGWTTRKAEEFETNLTVDTSTMTRSCIGFASSGRPDWPVPKPLIEPSDDPWQDKWWPVSDGVVLSDPMSTINPVSDERTGVWRRYDAPVPVILFDMQELRHVEAILLGLYSKPNYFKYPTQIKVEATTLFDLDANSQPIPPADPGAWVTVYDQAGPADPSSGQQTTRVDVPVNTAYRFFRVIFTMNSSSSYMVLHEIGFGDPVFTITSNSGARRLTVNSVTGTVTVQKVTP